MTDSPFQYKNGELHCENVPLSAVSQAHGTPTYIYSKAELLGRANAYLTAAAGVANNLICYAVKANGNPHLLRILAEAGLGADVTSGGELFLALKGGFSPDKILFSGVGKTAEEIRYALATNIHGLHVESEMELEQIGRIAAEMDATARITIRVNPDIAADTHHHIQTGRQAHKFGVSPQQALTMMRQVAAHPNLQPAGLAVHIGSQITQLAPFVQAAHFLVELAAETAASGIQLQYLDIGGGLGINYDNQDVPDPGEWVSAVTAPITAAGYGVVMEPGRSIIGPTAALLTQVIYTKQQGDHRFIITDAAMNDLIRPSLYSAYHPIMAVTEAGDDKVLETADVVGPICETGDTLGKARQLPKVKPGDLLAILQAGAYGFAMSSNYNGRVKTAEVLIDGDSFEIIRRRQSYDHLLDGIPFAAVSWG